MRIAINGLFLSLQNTGGGRYLTDLVNGLKPDNSLEYILFADGELARKNIVHNSYVLLQDCSRLTKFTPLRLLWENLFFARRLEDHNIDLLHAAGFTLPPQLKCKTVLTIFDTTFLHMPEVHQARKVAYFKRLMPVSVRRADRIIAISQQTKKDIMSYLNVPEGKISVIPVGISDDFTVINDRDMIEAIKHKYGLPQKYILFVGTLEPRKNLKKLIISFGALKKRGVEHQLVIVGKAGWHYSEIYQTVDQLRLSKDVIFTQYVDQPDMPLLYNGASLFIYPSLYEGFGIPIAEAMACGVPVITSNISSMPEVAGDAALLVNPYDTDEIAAAMQKVLIDSETAAALRSKGKERAKLFGLGAMVNKTVEVYAQVLRS